MRSTLHRAEKISVQKRNWSNWSVNSTLWAILDLDFLLGKSSNFTYPGRGLITLVIKWSSVAIIGFWICYIWWFKDEFWFFRGLSSNFTYPLRGLKQLDSEKFGAPGDGSWLLKRSQFGGDFTEQDVNLANKKSFFSIKKCRWTHLNRRALPELAPALFDFLGNVAVFPRPCPWSFGMMISNRQVWQCGSLGFWFQNL